MNQSTFRNKAFLFAGIVLVSLLFARMPATADPTKYPRLAQQALPAGVEPSFIRIDELVDAITAGKKPLIIDVRSEEEYRDTHIMGSLSIPLGEINSRLGIIPKDRPVVFY